MTTGLRPAPTRSVLESKREIAQRFEREKTMIDAAQAELFAEIDASGEYELEGYLSMTSLIRDWLGVSAGEASRRLAIARGLRKHPAVLEVFASAAIDLPRVRLLLDAASVSAPLFTRDQHVLIDTVAGLDMRQARRVVDYWKQAADQEAAAADAEHLHRRRRLHVSETLGGMVRIDGELDPEGGQIVLTALDSLTDQANLDPDDRRTPPQRRADALVDICSDHLTHSDTPTAKTVRPHITAVIGLDALLGRTGEPCELDPGTVITPEAARRLLCDSTVTRIITGPNSEPLDVGRATRTVPPGMRRALNFRDQHCQWPGCDRHWRWCDAHHKIHWADGGETSLENLILLCRHHHRMTHEGNEDPPPWTRGREPTAIGVPQAATSATPVRIPDR